MSGRILPLGGDLSSTIDRLRAIAAASADAMITEGPVNPDRLLLDVCAEVLALFREAEALRAQRVDYFVPKLSREAREAEHVKDVDILARVDAAERSASGKLVSIRKHKAQTPAGIYAKALIVKSSKTGAHDLARSLAEDLIANEALRRLLWAGIGGVS